MSFTKKPDTHYIVRAPFAQITTQETAKPPAPSYAAAITASAAEAQPRLMPATTKAAKPCLQASSEQPIGACSVFIDNSNIFIEGQKWSAKHRQLSAHTDKAFRIRYDELIRAIAKGRTVAQALVFGSRSVDEEASVTLWMSLSMRGFSVGIEARASREKIVDASLAMSISQHMNTCDPAAKDTIVILSGDRDITVIVSRILEHTNSAIEVFSFKSALNSSIQDLAKANAQRLHIYTLDSVLQSVPEAYFISSSAAHSHAKTPAQFHTLRQ